MAQTETPRLTKASHIALPMPCAPPVTTATLDSTTIKSPYPSFI
jgi:hypothetical protein